MEKINKIFILIFFSILLVPVFFFNYKENSISEIDNRQLTNNPLTKNAKLNERDRTDVLYDYISDRIGFRNFFIRSYLILNDVLFKEMVHPTYEYGKEKYIFFKGVYTNKNDSDDYYNEFINMLEKINNYCNNKNVPFIFVIEPSKSSVLQEYIKEGINYNNEWIDDFIKKIEDKNINIVNNYELLNEKHANNEIVFNKQYDAGHWNDLGAFYGVNNILERAKQENNNIHVNSLDEFKKRKELRKTLPVSEFPIKEYTITYNTNEKTIKNVTKQYNDGLLLNDNHRYFFYTINKARKNENTPKVLSFQGSYMNGYGYKYLENSFYEYIAVHNYGNIMNFDYYFNLFEPELVIFEVTEYTLSNTYFNHYGMIDFSLNPDIKEFDNYNIETHNKKVTIRKHKAISDIYFNTDNDAFDYAYIEVNNKIYDAKNNYGEVSLTLENKKINNNIKCILINKETKTKIVYTSF